MGRIIDQRNRETERLELPCGEWIEIYKVLTAGESRRLKNAGLKYTVQQGTEEGSKQTAEVGLDIAEMDFAKVLIRVRAWSLKDTYDNPVQINAENLDNSVDEDTFDEMISAIDGFTKRQEKEKNSNSPETPGKQSKYVGAGSTVLTS